MSNVDARMEEALEQFCDHVCSGVPLPEALLRTARESEFSADVIEVRAERRFGNLEDWQKRIQAKMATQSAIREYSELDKHTPAKAWLRQKLGREPTENEVTESDNLYLDRFLSKIPRD